MRPFPIFTALALIAAPVAGYAQTTAPEPAQTPPSVTQNHGEQAGQAFGNAGDSLADAARSTWHGLKNGWVATKRRAGAGWNAATQTEEPPPANPHPAR